MFLVCQSIRPPSLRGSENQAIFATRSPTAIRNIRPFRSQRKQIPETSRSGTSTTRHTRSRFLFDLPLPMGGWQRCDHRAPKWVSLSRRRAASYHTVLEGGNQDAALVIFVVQPAFQVITLNRLLPSKCRSFPRGVRPLLRHQSRA